MKKIFAIFVIVALSFALIAGCRSAGPSSMKYTQGVYSGTGIGMNGAVVVNVAFSENRILAVDVTEYKETYGVGQAIDNNPIDTIPKAIVEQQSLAVDVVTGATLTSNAIINAVADAVKQAGGDEAALRARAIARSASRDAKYTCDVVVAGAGVAGMAAAIEAASAGARVIIVEKAGIAGGSSTLCGGKIMATETKYMPDETSVALFDHMYKIGEGKFNTQKVRAFLSASNGLLEWYEKLGMGIDTVEDIFWATAPFKVVYNAGQVEPGHTVEFLPQQRLDGKSYGGSFTVPLEREAKRLGVTFIYNTAAKEIIMEGGKAAGFRCEGPGGSKVIIRAKSTVLATGGYGTNDDLLNESPELAASGYSNKMYTAKYCTGDGLLMARAIGAKNIVTPTVMGFMQNPHVFSTFYGLVVDTDGRRFTNEYAYFFRVVTDLAKTGSYVSHFIIDESYNEPRAQAAIATGTLTSANSVEELAQKINVSPGQLRATIERYNTLSRKGVDEDFGKDPSMMIPIATTKKLYAFPLQLQVYDTYGGVVTDINARVLDNNNNAINGLYAAGSVAFSDLINLEYPGCGFAIGTATYFGKVAGTSAAAFAK
jgi:succinate dehydrogenase/fumarate reductase flavoprotein subunit/uncharacterized protein with FMN-binding domain